MRKIFYLLLISVTSSYSLASILPTNNLALPITDKKSGLTEAQYHAVIDKVENLYRPRLARSGKKLTIQRLWESSVVNAGTLKNGNEIIIRLYGGYARHPMVTEDGYALVICHELGHHLGGKPRKFFDSTGKEGWPSVEGQADYFATLKCLRQVFQNEDNLQAIKDLEVPPVVSEGCGSFKEDWEKALCIRTTFAGIAVANISADIRNVPLPDVATPDPKQVESTFEAHPEAQCRLDTYFQGSICEVSSFRGLSTEDEVTGTCHKVLGHTAGLRPSCWFKSADK